MQDRDSNRPSPDVRVTNGGRSRARRVVILGGGFAGVSTAQELVRQLRREDRLARPGGASSAPLTRSSAGDGRSVEVVLLNRDNYFVFQPLLADIISGTIETTHVVVPLRRMLRDVDVEVGYVERVDVGTRHVELRRRIGGQVVRVPYDALVIALGSITDFTGVPGMAEHALGVRTLGDAFYLRNRALDMLEESQVEPDPDRRRRFLTFVVVGGGSTGVEVAAELHDLLEVARRSFPERTDPRVLLVHGGPYLVPSLGERLGRYTTKKLRQAGVELLLGRRLTKVNPESVELDDGTTIAAATIVSTVGNAPHPVVASLPAPKDARGWIMPDATFAVPGLDHVWAVGDCASIIDPKTGRPMPATAQHAVREGPHAARNVLAVLDGRQPTPFSYGQLGMLVSLGRFKGVGEIFGIKVSGFVAWFLWRTYYLLRLPTLDRKIRVALDWTLDFLLKRDIVEISVRRTRTRPGESPGDETQGEPVSVGAREAPEELVL